MVNVVSKPVQKIWTSLTGHSRNIRSQKVIIRLAEGVTKRIIIKEATRDKSKRSNSSAALVSYSPPHHIGSVENFWLYFWLTIFLGVGTIGTVGGLILAGFAPAPNCKDSATWTKERDYLFCIQEATQNRNLTEIKSTLASIKNWPSNHPLYSEAQQVIEEAYRTLELMAQEQIELGNLKEALDITNVIPRTSPLYSKVKANQKLWIKEWRLGKRVRQIFTVAIKQQDFRRALLQIKILAEFKSKYWNQLIADQLSQSLTAEETAWKKIAQVRQVAQPRTTKALSQAIALSSTIIRNSDIAATIAQKDRLFWSQQLLQIAQNRFKQGDYLGVADAVAYIPADLPTHQTAQDWIKISRARIIGGRNNSLSFLEALKILKPIKKQSAIAKLASVELSYWKTRLQDDIQLQIWQNAARIDQGFVLNWASQGIKEIAARNTRPQAKTLFLTWQQQAKVVAAQNNLAYAFYVAQQGSLDNLKAAVILTQPIQSIPELNHQAKIAIATWSHQIQSIQDQDLIIVAQNLAATGNLPDAIAVAQQIRPGQLLYKTAQNAINQWSNILITRDQQILSQAARLAYQNKFAQAIQLANQIHQRSPLRLQAQAAIGAWQMQRDGVLSANAIKTQSTTVVHKR